jgi:hypothetical protein
MGSLLYESDTATVSNRRDRLRGQLPEYHKRLVVGSGGDPNEWEETSVVFLSDKTEGNTELTRQRGSASR